MSIALKGLKGLLPIMVLAASFHGEALAASWLRYPAISADGSTIAFSALGEIWLVDAAGGTARQLTRSDALDTRPVWFPDGRIAFASDRHGNFDLFVQNPEGGSPERWSWHSAHDLPWAVTQEGRLLFSSGRTDPASSRLFPGGFPAELYSLGGPDENPRWEALPQVDEVSLAADGTIYYERVKAVEDEFRKHQQSSAAREIWIKHPDGSHEQLTDTPEDNREAVPEPFGEGWYWLSERSGSLNVWYHAADGSDVQLTFHEGLPVRHLSVSHKGELCYSWKGGLYRLMPGQEPQKVDVQIEAERLADGSRTLIKQDGASEAAISPDGREVAFIVRGEIFVSSVEYGTTRRVTNTPEQERDLAFSPNGRELYYSSERQDGWDLYRSIMPDSSDHHFYCATGLKEEELLVSPEDTFLPRVSPDGKELAFLANRTELRVMNLKSLKVRVVVPETVNYSYSDGDQHYAWSPDGKWFSLHFLTKARWMDEIGLVSAEGGDIINLTESGYSDYLPVWSSDGSAIFFRSDRYGLRTHASWGSEEDISAVFLNRKSWEEFQLTAEEYKALQPEVDEDDERQEERKSRGFFGWFKRGRDTGKLAEELLVEPEQIERRRARITEESGSINDFTPSLEGDCLYSLIDSDQGLVLVSHDLREKDQEVLMELGDGPASLLPQVRENELVILKGNGQLKWLKLNEHEQQAIPWRAEITLEDGLEWDYFFRHIWRQVREKFYLPDLHQAQWDELRSEYAAFLPHIDHKRDFAECMSEMLGELNASHTGCFVGGWREENDSTADLGLLFDPAWQGPGLCVQEVLAGGPFDRSDSRMRPGMILFGIAGEDLTGINPWRMLNRLANDPVSVAFGDTKDSKRIVEKVKPLSAGKLRELLYQRWVRRNADEVELLSDGRLGYVHVRSMDDASFRVVYHEALGRHADKEGLVVDTRHNGGGWLTDDLVTFLQGRRTYRTVVRPGMRVIGEEPYKTWNRPSIVLMNESNYSDAHLFPYAYKDNGVGSLLGMPVAGTGTAVWWERLMDGELVFGIPEVGIMDEYGNFLENQQLEPDFEVDNMPAEVLAGRDQQLEEAVRILQIQIDAPR
jgi:tricorn protease